MTVIAAPPMPQRQIARYWEATFSTVERDAKRWAIRLGNGERPLRPGEAARLRSFITTLRAMGATEAVAQMAAAVGEKFTDAASFSANTAMRSIPAWAEIAASDAAADFGWSNVPNTRAVTAAASGQIGWLTSDFQNMTTTARQFLVGQLGAAVIAGESPRDLAKRIAGVVDVASRRGQARSLMIARTTLARVYDLSSQEVYRVAEELGVIEGWRWVATEGACPVCAALHGTVFPVQVDTYRHPNCRCTMAPITKASPAYGTPVGERFDPFPDTEELRDKLQIRESKDGWWNWQIRPKHPRIDRPTMTLRQVVGGKKDPVQPTKPRLVKPAAKVKPVPQDKLVDPVETGLVEQKITMPKGSTAQDYAKAYPWLEKELRLGNGWLPDMLLEAKFARTRFFYDKSADIVVKIPTTMRVSKANLSKMLDGIPDAVSRGRVNMPLRPGETTVRRHTFNFDKQGKMRGADAYTYLGGDEVFVNPNQFQLLNPKSSLSVKRDVPSVPRWSVGESMPAGRGPFNTLVHEMGHNADRSPARAYANFAEGNRVAPNEFVKNRNDLYYKWVHDGTDGDRAVIGAIAMVQKSNRVPSSALDLLRKLTDGPTVYSRTNPAEMFAEAYAAWSYRDVITMGPRMRAWVEDYARVFGWV